MNPSTAPTLPPCYVVVPKLPMEDISRIVINPFYVKHKCGRCKQRVYSGPKCSSCSTYYHFKCGILRRECCGLKVDTTPPTQSVCPRCKDLVEFGPQCSLCHSTFHSMCLSPYETCCQLNLYEGKKAPKLCGKCNCPLDFGPKCPFCLVTYHPTCIDDEFACCGLQFTPDDHTSCNCAKCKKKLSLMAPMCLYCGRAWHGYCLSLVKNCCGRRVALEAYIIPSFKYVINYYKQFDRKRAMLRKLEEMVNRKASPDSPELRNKKKIAVAQTNTEPHVLDSVTIVNVKTELEEKEVEIEDSGPPVLEREENYSPEPSSSIHIPDITENDDSLKNLFEFLYKMVKKFPPQLQAQVKVDLFKVVTEAEMKCNNAPSLNL